MAAPGIWFSSMNFFVHSIMYSYFFLSTAGYKKYVRPVAPFITFLQVQHALARTCDKCSLVTLARLDNANGGWSLHHLLGWLLQLAGWHGELSHRPRKLEVGHRYVCCLLYSLHDALLRGLLHRQENEAEGTLGQPKGHQGAMWTNPSVILPVCCLYVCVCLCVCPANALLACGKLKVMLLIM